MIPRCGNPLSNLCGRPAGGGCGIYVIFNFASNKAYVGSSLNIDARLIHHRAMLRSGRHYNTHLQSAYSKYGERYFFYNVLELCDAESRIEREQFWVDDYQSFNESLGYNKIRNVRDTRTGKPNSIETRNKISDSLKRRWKLSPEIMENRSIKMRGIAPPISRSIAGAEKRAKTFGFISPDGRIFVGKNIARFCRENKLPESVMGCLSRNKYPPGSFMGWRTLT